MAKRMLTAGKMRGMISMKTRAVELIHEAAEHLSEARKYLSMWSDRDPQEFYEDVSEKLDDINENLIGMADSISEGTEIKDEEEDTDNDEEEGEEENEEEE